VGDAVCVSELRRWGERERALIRGRGGYIVCERTLESVIDSVTSV
jgi:hypothetical protein